MTELGRVDIEPQDHSLVARLRGEIDASNAASLEVDIITAIPNTAAGLVLDLSQVEYMDSSGIRMLFLVHGQLEQRGQHVRAVVPDTTPIKRILDTLGVAAVIPLDADLSAALVELAGEA
jgi:anti-anti-sigma factor